jgi:thiosulfate reductase cytochrome b subunit
VNPLRALPLVAALALALPAAVPAQQPVNPIHPLFAPLDEAGQPAARAAAVSSERTCGACHDVAFIGGHATHPRTAATCVECHVDGGALPVDPARLDGGRLRREDVRIGRPRAESCARCHGVVVGASGPVLLPEDLEAAATPERSFALTLGEGAIVSPQRPRDSFLDLEDKEALTGPWDVHAARGVDCAACHHARNDPREEGTRRAPLPAVAHDPRRPSTAEFVHQPDHRLVRPDCRSCHAPLAVHAFLPYKERHLEVLACQACHASAPRGPAAEQIDATVATAAGTPAVVFRNLARPAGTPLNAAPITPLRPLLALRAGPDGVTRLAPMNVVLRSRWVSGPGRTEVPFAQVDRAFRPGGRSYAPEVLAAFDADHDGRLSEVELRLDRPEKVALVAARLAALGVAEPAVDNRLEVHPLAHGVAGREGALRDCQACHGEAGRLSGAYPLATYLPGGVPPGGPGSGVSLGGVVRPAGEGLALLRTEGAFPGLHVMGWSRQRLADGLGFALFALVFLSAAGHGLARLVLRRRAAHAPAVPASREYVFGRYERLWHWTMAGSGLGLIATGFVIHGAGWLRWAMPVAVPAHNALAVLLAVNAFLALFYHLSTAAIRAFIPRPQGFLARVLEHLAYHARGVFRGGPHPLEPAGEKLNPLQQVTYLALLNVLFPLQIATGALLWAVGHWPALGRSLGGLGVIAPLHDLGAWLFLTFFVLHVYLVTTGRTVGEHLRTMVTGYRPAEPAGPPPEGA